MTLVIGPNFAIPLGEFEFTYARSSGPGGQNVNKVNSKALLRWPVVSSPSLPAGVRERFLDKYGSRLTQDGDLILTSQKYRDQLRNVDDCLAKLQAMLLSVISPPTPRRPTKPSRAARQRRVVAKREHSQKKQQRRPPAVDG
jgi:ribosome-associated protein